MFTAYQPNIPTGTVNLDIDYQNLQSNFTQLNNIFGIDHTPFNIASQSGFHKSIHMIPQSSGSYPPIPPATVAGVGQLFTALVNDGYNNSQALFYLTGGGNLRQLTSNFSPTATANGSTFMAGGITMQWGFVAMANTPRVSGDVVFATNNRSFAHNCFCVQLTLISITAAGTNSSNNSLFIRNTTVSNLGFSWKCNNEGNDFSGFYWLAIGN